MEDSHEHAQGTYRDNAKTLAKITNSLRCNFEIGFHPRINSWFSVFTEEKDHGGQLNLPLINTPIGETLNGQFFQEIDSEEYGRLAPKISGKLI